MTELLMLGSHGDAVLALRHRLKNAGFNVDINDRFNDALRLVVIEFQRQKNLIADGIVGPKTMAALNGENTSKLLRQSDMEWAAAELDCELAAIMAVNQIESRGRGFHSNGKPIVLFERHIMRRRMLANGIDASTVGQAEHVWPNLVSRQTGGYKSGLTENYRLQLAGEIHPIAALESASWGQFQVMGFHWERLGYNSASEFATAMSENEFLQLTAFVEFIKTDHDLHHALRACDWPAFARRYNGKGYRKNRYDQKLASAYASHGGHHAE